MSEDTWKCCQDEQSTSNKHGNVIRGRGTRRTRHTREDKVADMISRALGETEANTA